MPKIKRLAQSSSENKDHLIQFRVDDVFLKRLLIISGRKETPVGVLARQWVAERLESELQVYEQEVNHWVEGRSVHLETFARTYMEKSMSLGFHLVPLSKGNSIDEAEQYIFLSKSFESALKGEYRLEMGVNIAGFSARLFPLKGTKAIWYSQFFGSGQIEGIYNLPDTKDGIVLASDIENCMTRTILIYARLLEGLKIYPPIEVRMTLLGATGYRVSGPQRRTPGDVFSSDSFWFPSCVIANENQLANKESLEAALARPIQMVWNAAGFAKKPS